MNEGGGSPLSVIISIESFDRVFLDTTEKNEVRAEKRLLTFKTKNLSKNL